MKNKKILGAAIAATMLVSAACGLVACDKDAADAPGNLTPQTPVGNTGYTVTFNPGEGQLKAGAQSTLKTDKNGKLTVSALPEAERTDHKFEGWSLTAGATSANVTLATTYSKDTTVYAVYTENTTPLPAAEYKITFDYGDGSGSPDSAQTVNGTLADLPQPTAPEGKKFDAWYTGANGAGDLVGTDYPFTASITIYANYTDNGSVLPVGDKNGVYKDGALVVEFTEALTLEYDAERQYGAVDVTLSAGDEVIIKIDGEQLTHTAGELELWLASELNPHGVYLDQTTGIFKIKAGETRAFTIVARYYTADNVCWSIEFTDGLTDTLQKGGAYLVGEGFENASWNLSTDLYIDPEAGLVVTLNSNSRFKVCSCKADQNGSISPSDGRDWIYNDGSKYREDGGNYLSLSGINDSNNGSCDGTHTYKVTVENGIVVFTLIS